MNINKIKEHIYGLSMSIDQMKFEGMWELPNGVTLNSYIVKGDKTAIIDGFIGWDGVADTLYDSLGKIDINPEDIDYLIVNHMEPDHSGWIENFKKINNHFKVIGTQKSANLIKAFYGDGIEVEVVKEGDSIDLGNDLVLDFYPVPNVHWPETMMTYERKTKSLFSCDLYGAFGKMDGIVFDDEMTEEQVEFYELEGVRYFSNVMTTFSMMAERAIKKTESLDIEMVAPGHGPIYRSHPEKIIDAYKRFTQYAKGYGKNQVTILWGSMYGMTQKAVESIENELNEMGINFVSLQLPQSTESDIVTQVFQSAAIILAMPTYEYKMFPPMAHAIDELGRKRISNKHAFRFGSYGWSGGAEKELNQLVETYKMKWNFIDSVEFEGKALDEDIKKIKDGVKSLVQAMKDYIIE
jgi:flavorubredoxin